MKQFYETYSIQSECFLLWISLNDTIVSPVATQLQCTDNKEYTKVSALPTQLKNTQNLKVSALPTLLESHNAFLNNLLLKLIWTNHLEIL